MAPSSTPILGRFDNFCSSYTKRWKRTCWEISGLRPLAHRALEPSLQKTADAVVPLPSDEETREFYRCFIAKKQAKRWKIWRETDPKKQILNYPEKILTKSFHIRRDFQDTKSAGLWSKHGKCNSFSALHAFPILDTVVVSIISTGSKQTIRAAVRIILLVLRAPFVLLGKYGEALLLPFNELLW